MADSSRCSPAETERSKWGLAFGENGGRWISSSIWTLGPAINEVRKILGSPCHSPNHATYQYYRHVLDYPPPPLNADIICPFHGHGPFPLFLAIFANGFDRLERWRIAEGSEEQKEWCREKRCTRVAFKFCALLNRHEASQMLLSKNWLEVIYKNHRSYFLYRCTDLLWLSNTLSWLRLGIFLHPALEWDGRRWIPFSICT